MIDHSEDPPVPRSPFKRSQKDLAAFRRTVAVVRDELGSYDTIARLLSEEAGPDTSCTGVSVRRWLIYSYLPVDWACALVRVMQKRGHALSLLDFHPYLEDYFPASK